MRRLRTVEILRTWGRCLAAACLIALMSGCASIEYYLQAASGQLDLWRRARAIDEVIEDATTAPALREKLRRTLVIREFASRELGLPDNASYRRYADLERAYVVWNVFAAPEFSLDTAQWCFPVAGCVSYRGYFSEADARRFATRLAAEGKDVFVNGVPAYSTLGWFADPVLNTFVHFPELQVARLIFHELAHQVVYVRDDTVFNESFAVVVEREGLRRWIDRHGTESDRKLFALMTERRAGFLRLIETYRQRLAALYRDSMTPEAMRERKARTFEEMETDYRRLRAEWGGFGGYDRWFAQKPNNAHIVSVAIYTQLVPALEALLRRNGGDLAKFYDAVRELAAYPQAEREARLKSLSSPQARVGALQ
jgi:predicted aminopeptidase